MSGPSYFPTGMFAHYLTSLSRTIARGDAREESYYPALKDLITAFAHENGKKKVDVTVLPKQTDAGNPDFRVWDGSHRVIGYIEAKAPEVTDLSRVAKSEQLKRYLKTFPNVILTNFSEFWFFRDGEEIGRVTLAIHQQHKKLKSEFTLKSDGAELFAQLLLRFLGYNTPAITRAEVLAKELAHRTRFLRDQVIRIELEEASGEGHTALHGFYEAFQKHLIATLTEEQFADLYAQTLTYGMFAARIRARGEFTRTTTFNQVPKTIGVLRDIFRYISLGDPPKALSVLIDDIADVLQATEVDKLLVRYKGSDPIIHFYETFLAEYDPALREKRGVYYTPEPVVGYIVRSLQHILQESFGKAAGFADPSVTVLDPAGGTLTFPAHAVRVAVEEHVKRYGDGDRDRFIREHVLRNFYAFELMMAPYAVGHLKMSFLLEELGHALGDNERFPLYLTNTLELEDIAQTQLPGLSSLSEESKLAGRVKREQPILVVLGNPPYSGISANINDWTEELLKTNIDGCQSYYEVDGKPLGEKKLWLQDDYVKFIRFAQWKIQKSGSGVLGFITNHGYLENPTFRGMRQSLLRTFDKVYVLDLHGNTNKKEKAPDGSPDANVFDIQQGVAIALFVKKPGAEKKPGTLAVTKRADLYGSQEGKYFWLDKHDMANTKWQKLQPETPWYFFKPFEDSGSGYETWLKLDQVFGLSTVGFVSGRDTVNIHFDERTAFNVPLAFSKMDATTAREAYALGKDSRDWTVHTAQQDFIASKAQRELVKPVCYRPFDIRFSYYTGNSRGLYSSPQRNLMQHMLQENLAVVSSRRVEINRVWEHAFVSAYILEHHSMSGKEVNYLFPLYLYPTKGDKDDLFTAKRTEREPNLSAELVEKLAKAHKKKPTPEEVLHYVYAVLYSPPYRQKYAELLRIDFPRIPFTADRKVFEKMAALGERLVSLHLLKSKELDKPVVRFMGKGADNTVGKLRYDAKADQLWINEQKYFDGIPEALWNYHIGGYQVLEKYLKDRKGMVLTDPPRYCRIATALAKTMEVQEELARGYREVEKNRVD